MTARIKRPWMLPSKELLLLEALGSVRPDVLSTGVMIQAHCKARMPTGSLYSLLDRLVQKKVVRAYTREQKRVYALTELGQRILRAVEAGDRAFGGKP